MLRHGLLLTLTLCAASPAQQVVTVNAAGGADYIDLQTAIDAVPAGSIIRVTGNPSPFGWLPITIRKSLVIVGATVRSDRPPAGGYDSAIKLVGGGQDRVVLRGFSTTCWDAGMDWQSLRPVIAGSGFAEIVIADSVIDSPVLPMQKCGSYSGRSGIEVAGARRVVITNTRVTASPANYACIEVYPDNGRPAISAPGATVLLHGATVKGGDGADAIWWSPPQSTVCPCAARWGGLGGPGVEAARVYATSSTITGGRGGAVAVGYPRSIHWGRQIDARPIVASVAEVLGSGGALPARTMQIGQPWSWTTQLGQLALIGIPAASPIDLGGFLFFLEPASLVTVSAGNIAFTVPNNVGLVGSVLGIQTFFYSHPLWWYLTGPAWVAVSL